MTPSLRAGSPVVLGSAGPDARPLDPSMYRKASTTPGSPHSAQRANEASSVRVLVIAFDGEANPSTRLRVLQFIPALEGFGFTFSTFFVLQNGRASVDEKRLAELVAQTDVVFVQRVLRKPVVKLLERAGKPVIFDFDDALHYIRQSQYPAAVAPRGLADQVRNTYRTLVRGGCYYSGRKKSLDKMLGLATTVIAGNEWLVDELGLGSDQAVVIPTSVWVSEAPVKVHQRSLPVTLGWIGTQGNLSYLDLLDEPFRQLHRRYGDDVELKVVSSASIETSLLTRFEPWSLDTESDAVLSFDVGIMPLQDDPFSRGKSAFKAVFCMSRGVPVVASPVGANTALIEHGMNGWLAANTDDWVEGISVLVEDVAMRTRMGQLARQTIEERYSAAGVAETLCELLYLNAARKP